jgi:hypothetical protein
MSATPPPSSLAINRPADAVEQLVHEVVQTINVEPPTLLSGSAPTLALQSDAEPPAFYLIGLIGGKDVGKSSLANAIAGVKLGTPSHIGEGTREVTAYVHRSIEVPVRELLNRIANNRFSLVVHEHESLRLQVLVDLPDIDSKYQDHIDLTRSMLRHLLFPIFIQSVEKYADQRPQQLLVQVAQGNDPANFVFCLNKIDQLAVREGASAASTIAEDYSSRLQKLLSLASKPKVHCISAIKPDQFDLPDLRRFLSRDRDQKLVRRSLELARGRRQLTLVQWLEDQRLDDRLARSNRTIEDARQLADDKLLTPIRERIEPALLDDPALKSDIIERASRRRIARWPIVNVIDVLLAPITSVFRRNVLGLTSTRQSVRAIVKELTPPLDANIRTVFADVRRRDPSIVDAYGDAAPWNDRESELAIEDLTTRLADAMEKRKAYAVDTAGNGHGGATAPVRWLLTLGAAIWFPIVQPVLEIVLNPYSTITGLTRETIWHVVRLLGSTYLLQSVGFLVVYFVLLWATLRYLTGRRCERLLRSADSTLAGDAATSIEREADLWADGLFEPLAAQTKQLERLVNAIDDCAKSTRAA